MTYFVSRNGEQEGPYTQEEIRSKLASGQLDAGDFVWHEKMTEWQTLGNTPPFSAPPSSTVPPGLIRKVEPTPYYQKRSGTSGMAIASMICGICAHVFCLSLLAGIPAVVLGHMSLSRIRKSRSRSGGKGMAIAGLILGYLSILAVPIMIALALPALNQAIFKGKQVRSMNNIKQISAACHDYAQNHDGRFPSSLEELNLASEILSSPLAENSGEKRYVYVPGYTLSSPSNLIFIYDKNTGNQRRPSYPMGRIDGTCEILSQSELEKNLQAPSGP